MLSFYSISVQHKNMTTEKVNSSMVVSSSKQTRLCKYNNVYVRHVKLPLGELLSFRDSKEILSADLEGRRARMTGYTLRKP